MAGLLITGASGLLGSWVLHHLELAGQDVSGITSAEGDLLAPGAMAALLERRRPRAVVHLAWCASGRVGYRDSDDNERWRRATLELAEAARRYDAALWLTGTVVDDVEEGGDAYTRAKAALRRELAPVIGAGELGWLRPTYVVDERRRRPALVAHTLAASERGEAVRLRTPYAAHDFVHASDVGAAVAVAVDGGLTGYLSVGSGRVRRVCDLVTALGADWTSEPDAPAPSAVHAEEAVDIRWLSDRGWTPTRTRELFGDD